MFYRLIFAGVLTASAWAQPASPQVELANLREDVRGLNQRVADLVLRMEQLEKENSDLRSKAATSQKSYATVAQLNDAVADLNRAIKAADADNKTEILQQVAGQLEKLAKATNASLDSMAKGQATRAALPKSFSDDFPKEGVNYTVLPGESLAAIAKKLGVKQQDIINANKLSDPSRLQAGQTLFIPGGK